MKENFFPVKNFSYNEKEIFHSRVALNESTEGNQTTKVLLSEQ